MNDNDSDYNGDSELSPEEIPCPLCGQRETRCSHFLADFDCTFDGQGKYAIGLGGGALYEIDVIGEFFESIAYCYARARYKGKSAKLPKAPKGTVFRTYVQALKEVRLDAKAYDSEEDFCWDFRVNIERYAVLVRLALLEILDCDVYEEEAFTETSMSSSRYAIWYCSDASAAAAKLKDKLARCLSDFKRENGLV